MFAASKTASVSGGYQISRSLRFNSADTAYLSRTYSNSATDLKKQTFSFWYKRTEFATTGFMFGGYDGSSASSFAIGFFTTNGIGNLTIQIDGTSSPNLLTTQVFRDPSAWYHIVIAIDTTQATSSNRLLLYVNGSQVTSFSTATYPALNSSSQFALTNSRNAVGSAYSGNSPMNGYMTEVNFIDGQSLTPSSFGETNAQTGVWQPKAYSGSYGTNGFYLNFSDNSNTTAATLGKDYSGNGNNWTPNNFSVTAGAGNDSLVDSPTSYGTDTGVGGEVRGNYATLNAVGNTSGRATLSNGNLDVVPDTSGSYYPMVPATIGVTSGKWYWEYTLGATNNTGRLFGIVTSSATVNNYIGFDAYGWGYFGATGQKYTNNTGSSYGASFTNGDVVGVAFDADAGTLVFYKNGTSQGTAFSGLTSGPYFPAYSLGSSGNNGTTSLNFGQRPFAYTAPSGYKALCTQNLPTPTIGATTATQAGKYFNPVLYTGTGATLSVTGANFQPDLVWIKQRNASRNHNLYDAVRGTLKVLQANVTDAEVNYAGSLTSFDSDGFSLGTASDVNVNAATYVAWNWKANGSGSTNTAGSITSTVSANTTSGFSVVNWTQPASGTYTIGHGLGVAPAMIIMKSRTAVNNWAVYHQSIGYTQYGRLNTTDAFTADSSVWVAAPTSSVFSQIVNYGTGGTSIAYCFAEVAGYSKFGSYIGNNSADGPFVYCGFRPAFVMIKSANQAVNWVIFDTKRSTTNVASGPLFPNASSSEGNSTPQLDILSNGFKWRNTDANSYSGNVSGDTYIFAAFAEAPLKYSLAR